MRYAVPLAALLVFAALGTLWASGLHGAYFAVLRRAEFVPFEFPFLDIHAVLSAAQCHHAGFDVYLNNPCDALGRIHDYSPLWLRIVPAFLGTDDTIPAGLVLDLSFIASLALVFRPAGAREAAFAILAILSPTVFFAVERANNDLAIFILIVLGCELFLVSSRSASRARLGAYALWLLAAFLKYYPLVLLIMVGRERLRRALVLSLVVLAAVAAFVAWWPGEMREALADIPTASPFAGTFSARNLPFGLVGLIEQLPAAYGAPAAYLLLAMLSCALVARLPRHVAAVDRLAPAWDVREMHYLATASILLPAIFFAGQNISYRAVLFLLAIPGLVALRRGADDEPTRTWLTRMLAALIFVMWQDTFRNVLLAGLRALPPEWPMQATVLVGILFWLVRELIWWWLIAGFAAFAVAFVRQLPAVRELLAIPFGAKAAPQPR